MLPKERTQHGWEFQCPALIELDPQLFDAGGGIRRDFTLQGNPFSLSPW
jgi:hypothetical protein